MIPKCNNRKVFQQLVLGLEVLLLHALFQIAFPFHRAVSGLARLLGDLATTLGHRLARLDVLVDPSVNHQMIGRNVDDPFARVGRDVEVERIVETGDIAPDDGA